MGNYLAPNLEYLRDLFGLTNKKLGDVTEIGQTISNYISGRTEPSLENLLKLAEYFNISLDDLLLRDLRKEGIKNIVNEPPVKYNVSRKLAEMESQIRQLSELIKKGQKGK